MLIEIAEKDDHVALTNITYLGKSFWGYDEKIMDQWKDDLTISPEYIVQNETFKLISNREIIGFYSFLKIDKHILKLDFLFILPQFIGSGIGKFLINDAIEKAKNMDIQRIILDAHPNAENFYKKFGFKTYGKLSSSIENRFLPQMELLLF